MLRFVLDPLFSFLVSLSLHRNRLGLTSQDYNNAWALSEKDSIFQFLKADQYPHQTCSHPLRSSCHIIPIVAISETKLWEKQQDEKQYLILGFHRQYRTFADFGNLIPTISSHFQARPRITRKDKNGRSFVRIFVKKLGFRKET